MASVSCMQLLHVCVVMEGEWRWTEPFGIGGNGARVLPLCVGRHTVELLVKTEAIGGLQKQVSRPAIHVACPSLRGTGDKGVYTPCLSASTPLCECTSSFMTRLPTNCAHICYTCLIIPTNYWDLFHMCK